MQGRLPGGREAFDLPTARRRSEETLASLGLETSLDRAARLEEEGHTAAARALRRSLNNDPAEVLALLRSLPPTRGGHHGREVRVAMCGVAFVALECARPVAAPRSCKDRLCPSCGERRRRRFAASLRALVAAEQELGRSECLVFATLTQPKLRLEPPRQALRRLLAAMRRFREQPWGRRYLKGGVRSLEVTARAAGTMIGQYQVRVPGVHAHLHCILDLDPAGRSTLAAAWCQACDGASAAAVDVQDLSAENVYQVGDYVLDMTGLLDMLRRSNRGGLEYSPPAYVRAVLEALHGARLVAAWGTWKHHDLGLREPPGGLIYGDRSVYTLATEPDAPPVHFRDGTSRAADEVLKTIGNRRRRSPEP